MKACALTDTGRVRTANQDYVYASVEPVGSLPNLFVVADGMGGHQAGDYASRYIVENLVTYLQYTENSQIVPLLREGILKVNTQLYQESKENRNFPVWERLWWLQWPMKILSMWPMWETAASIS